MCDSQPNLKCNILICHFAEAIDLALDGATEARMDVLECDSGAFFFPYQKGLLYAMQLNADVLA